MFRHNLLVDKDFSGNVETAQEAIKVGAGDYVIKPFASKDILEAVAKYLP